MIVPRSVALVFVPTLVGGLSGCGHEASLIRDAPTGSLVTYPVQRDADVLSSQGRRDAMGPVRGKCPQESRLLKVGELPKVSQRADQLWRPQLGTDRVWGIQLVCESAEPH